MLTALNLYIIPYIKHFKSMSLEIELQFFKQNQKELLSKYEGKFLVIKDQKVVGVYDSEIEAYTQTQNNFELGTFLIQQCLPGEDSFSQTFHSRVLFA